MKLANECNIDKDLPTGKEAELHFMKYAKDWKSYTSDYETKSDYDLKLIHKERNTSLTVEIKNDVASYGTGNLGFEFQQYDRNGGKTPSGFLISKADFWIHYYYTKNSWPVKGTYAMIDMASLKEWLDGFLKGSNGSKGFFRIAENAGDNGNDLLVVKQNACETFFRYLEVRQKCTIHNLPEEEIRKHLKIAFKQIEGIHRERTKTFANPITILQKPLFGTK